MYKRRWALASRSVSFEALKGCRAPRNFSPPWKGRSSSAKIWPVDLYFNVEMNKETIYSASSLVVYVNADRPGKKTFIFSDDLAFACLLQSWNNQLLNTSKQQTATDHMLESFAGKDADLQRRPGLRTRLRTLLQLLHHHQRRAPQLRVLYCMMYTMYSIYIYIYIMYMCMYIYIYTYTFMVCCCYIYIYIYM